MIHEWAEENSSRVRAARKRSRDHRRGHTAHGTHRRASWAALPTHTVTPRILSALLPVSVKLASRDSAILTRAEGNTNPLAGPGENTRRADFTARPRGVPSPRDRSSWIAAHEASKQNRSTRVPVACAPRVSGARVSRRSPPPVTRGDSAQTNLFTKAPHTHASIPSVGPSPAIKSRPPTQSRSTHTQLQTGFGADILIAPSAGGGRGSYTVTLTR